MLKEKAFVPAEIKTTVESKHENVEIRPVFYLPNLNPKVRHVWSTDSYTQEMLKAYAERGETIPEPSDLFEEDVLNGTGFAEPAPNSYRRWKEETRKKFTAPLISKVFEHYATEQIGAGNWKAKTESQNRTRFAAFVRLMGDQPADAYQREDFVCYRDKLKKEPTGRIDDSGRALTLDTETIDKYLTIVRSTFEYALNNGQIDRHYANKLTIGISKRERKRRRWLPYSSDELSMLLAGSAYSVKKDATWSPYMFWLIPLAIHTGARLSELCQLQVEDVFKDEDVWCLRITDEGDGKSVKSDLSDRVVPLHFRLIEMGFLNFVAECKIGAAYQNEGDRRLFNTFQFHPTNGPGHTPGKWYGRYKKRCGISHEKKAFHSFRGTVINELKQKGFAEDVAAAIAGHDNEEITFETYSQDYPVAFKKQVVEAIDYGIDFSRLLDPRINPWVKKP